jgi:uncharacterized protein
MISLIVKPTDSCNARCLYCSVRDKSKRQHRMTSDMVRLLLTRIGEYLETTPADTVNITWHGGEPLLMGPAFYQDVVALEADALGVHRSRLSHSIQSNLTMLTDAWYDVLKALRVRTMGTSIEFVPGLRGLGSRVDSTAYQRLFFDATERLGRWGIGWGGIYVVTSRSIDRPEDVVNYCMNLVQQSGGFRLNPLYLEGEARRAEVLPLGIGAAAFGHFLGRAFRVWWPRRKSAPVVEPFQSYCRVLMGEAEDLCCDDSGRCGRSHLGIDAMGRVYQCGRAMDSEVLEYGHLATHGLGEILSHPLKQQLEGRTSSLAGGECAGCSVFHLCHGGCPIDGYIYKDRWHGNTIWCESKKILLEEYLLPTLARDTGLVDVGRRGCHACAIAGEGGPHEAIPLAALVRS